MSCSGHGPHCPLVALVGSGLGLGRVVTYSVMYLTGSKSTTFRGDQIMHRHGVGVGLDVGFFRTPCSMVPIHIYLWEPIPAAYFLGIGYGCQVGCKSLHTTENTFTSTQPQRNYE